MQVCPALINFPPAILLAASFKLAVQKITTEHQIPALHQRWTEEDERLWEKLQDLIKNYGRGNEDRLFREVYGLIEVASREYYAMHEDEKSETEWTNKYE